MIAIIADDLTGAAELAGIAWGHGLSAEVQTSSLAATAAQVVALNVQSRDSSAEAAAESTRAAFRKVVAARPEWIYKKCDSVLRGQVVAEIAAAFEATGLKRALLIPANPSRERIIRNGQYFVAGDQLEDTPFADDPDYPRRTSSVKAMLGGSGKLLRGEEAIGAEGIFVPDMESREQLARWGAAADATMLPVGAADFFETLLALRRGVARTTRPAPAPPAGPTLFVCGSPLAWDSGRKDDCRERLVPFFTCQQFDPSWLTRRAATELLFAPAVMIASGSWRPSEESETLHAGLISAARDIVRGLPIERICVEGGATAHRLASRMSWRRFEVVYEWAPGVVELRPVGGGRKITMIVKVGSYDWPNELWPRR